MRPVKSPGNSIGHKSQKICYWTRRPENHTKGHIFSNLLTNLSFTSFSKILLATEKKTNKAAVFRYILLPNRSHMRFSDSGEQSSLKHILKNLLIFMKVQVHSFPELLLKYSQDLKSLEWSRPIMTFITLLGVIIHFEIRYWRKTW